MAKLERGVNDLATLRPDLAAEWHPTKNGNLKPSDVTKGKYGKYWWKCKGCGYEWQTSIHNRIDNGSGCPSCNGRTQTSFPEQAIYYYILKVFPDTVNRNKSYGKELDIFIPSLRVGIEYDGYPWHATQESRIKDNRKSIWCQQNNITLYRVRDRRCQKISDINCFYMDYSIEDLKGAINWLFRLLSIEGVIVDLEEKEKEIKALYYSKLSENSLALKYPELILDFDYDKNNGLSPDKISYGNTTSLAWVCHKCGYEWDSTIHQRRRSKGCPRCVRKEAAKKYSQNSVKRNNIVKKCPALLEEWDYERNQGINPSEISVMCKDKVWWKCKKCGYEWQTSVKTRYKDGSGCLNCARVSVKLKNIKAKRDLKRGINDLATMHPELLKDWDYEMNSEDPKELTCGLSLKAFWRCNLCGNKWQARIADRARGVGCPECSKKLRRKMKLVVGENDLATIRPDLLKEWDYEKNDYWTPEKVTQYSKEQVWWKCSECGESFLEWVVNKCNGTGKCPKCGN